ncbi:Hypp171 [Branchiostoma lanceolatum]|uniref:Hypp171 protein n=1 Tax=Branchiostoma lanceolatum TaxID=7740 RepID=A0A8J9W1Y7_BRALA|nr:Hypp171 [Branchiostoma lanceolatum]
MKGKAEENRPPGPTKKFLYRGPNRPAQEDEDAHPEFPPRKRSIPTGFDFDLDEVWSIKKNIPIPPRTPRGLGSQVGTKITTTGFYSRHTNVKKDAKPDPLGMGNSDRSRTGQLKAQDASPTWKSRSPGFGGQPSPRSSADDDFDFEDDIFGPPTGSKATNHMDRKNAGWRGTYGL